MRNTLFSILLLGSAACAAGDSSYKPPDPPDSIPPPDTRTTLVHSKDDGDRDQGEVQTIVRLRARADRNGVPIPGVMVHWGIFGAYPGADIEPDSSKTDIYGNAVTYYLVGQTVTSQQVFASVPGHDLYFTVFGTPGPAMSAVLAYGDGTVYCGSPPCEWGLAVKVQDRFGNGVEGVPVNWQVTHGTGVLFASSVLSNTTGGVDNAITFNGIPDSAVIEVTPDGLAPVAFHLSLH